MGFGASGFLKGLLQESDRVSVVVTARYGLIRIVSRLLEMTL